jgi:hypothetical protein
VPTEGRRQVVRIKRIINAISFMELPPTDISVEVIGPPIFTP